MAQKSDMRKAALRYAEFLWHVFPVVPRTKIPIPKQGFKDATIDPDIIAAWWDKYTDANIGLSCSASGVVALDGDPSRYNDESRDIVAKLMSDDYATAIQSTPTKGHHFVYMVPPGAILTNSSGQLPPGIDVRANGYILLTPSIVQYRGDDAVAKGVEDGFIGRYRWQPSPLEMPPQPLPDFVIDLLKTRPPERLAPIALPPLNGNHGTDRYAAAALEKELDTLARTPEGGRNEQLNVSAFSLGQLVGGGALDESEVIDKLETVALAIGLDEREIKRTIQSGLTKGKTQPRGVPEVPALKFGRRQEVPKEDEAPGKEESPKLGPSKTIQLALRKMDYVFQLNELRDRIELDDGLPLHDGEQATIVAQLFEQGVKNKSLILDVILAEAWANRYDPLREFIDSLEWDGTDYIEMLGGWFICKNEPVRLADGSLKSVIAVWLKRWLIGAVGKALDGVQNPMLVLAGSQGIGKSEFARWLCSPLADYFVSSPIVPDNTDHLRWLAGNFIWEVAELGATTRKADVEGLKAFLTRPECTYRVPYAKNEVHRRARASFVGTINLDNAGFLMDATGNRRFLSAELVSIQWEAYTRNIDPVQLWAQAAYLYSQDRNSWKLTFDEEKARDVINEEYGAEDPIIDAIEALYDVVAEVGPETGNFIPTTEIIALLANSIKEPSTRQLQLGLTKALRRLNVTKGRKEVTRGPRGYWGLTRKFVRTSNAEPPNY